MFTGANVMKNRISILVSFAVLGIAGAARAASIITYTAVPQGGTITFNANDTFNIYLQEQLTAGSTSQID